MKLLKKLTVKTVHGRKLQAFDKDTEIGAERIVLTVYGRADKFENGENTLPSGDISQYIRFRGDFAAYAGVIGNGDEYRSGVLIMPEIAGDLLAGMLSGEGVTSVNFGFMIGIRHTETPIGYEYYAEPLMKQESETDPLAAIKGAVKDAAKALPAPASSKKKAKKKASKKTARAASKKKTAKKVRRS